MATPTEFGEQNCTFTAPEGRPDILPLPAKKYTEQDGTPAIMSCWKLNDEELEEVKRTGCIYVASMGYGIYPLYVTGIYPEANVLREGHQ